METKGSVLLMLVNILDKKSVWITLIENLSKDNCIKTIYSSTVDSLNYRILRDLSVCWY